VPAPYFVILDNSVADELLAPGLPYWTYPLVTLPTSRTAGRFVDDVLYQSELWANAANGGDWVSLRLMRHCHMCPRCGHLLVNMGEDDRTPIHIVWFIARNPQPQIMGHEAALHLGLWHDDYLDHRCRVNFFDAGGLNVSDLAR
jgi:hypothetical protein